MVLNMLGNIVGLMVVAGVAKQGMKMTGDMFKMPFDNKK